MRLVPLGEVVGYLDTYLRTRELPDSANAVNGLQVENGGAVGRIVAAVDASQETIDGVTAGRADGGAGVPALLIVHHGLFWDGNIPLTGRRYRRVRRLMEADAALYAAHIPLDVHPEVGNNAVLARRLEVADVRPFGLYKGVSIGVMGTLDIGRDDLATRLNTLLETTCRVIPGGPPQVSRVGIVTGGAADLIAEARDAGLDTFITGEGAHHTYFDAMEWGVNVIYAGHYATEQVGVQALAEHVGSVFQLPWEFHRHPTGL